MTNAIEKLRSEMDKNKNNTYVQVVGNFLVGHIEQNPKDSEKIMTADKTIVKSLDEMRRAAEKTADEVREKANKAKEKAEKAIIKLQKDLEKAQSSGVPAERVQSLEQELAAARQQVQDLTAKINEPITVEPAIIEKVPEEIEQELESLRSINKLLEDKVAQSNNVTVKFRIYFEGVKDGFRNLLESLAEIEDIETREKYKKAVGGLISKMAENL